MRFLKLNLKTINVFIINEKQADFCFVMFDIFDVFMSSLILCCFFSFDISFHLIFIFPSFVHFHFSTIHNIIFCVCAREFKQICVWSIKRLVECFFNYKQHEQWAIIWTYSFDVLPSDFLLFFSFSISFAYLFMNVYSICANICQKFYNLFISPKIRYPLSIIMHVHRPAWLGRLSPVSTFAQSREGVNGNRKTGTCHTSILWSVVNVSFYVFHQRNKSHIIFDWFVWTCFYFIFHSDSLCFHSNVILLFFVIWFVARNVNSFVQQIQKLFAVMRHFIIMVLANRNRNNM